MGVLVNISYILALILGFNLWLCTLRPLAAGFYYFYALGFVLAHCGWVLHTYNKIIGLSLATLISTFIIYLNTTLSYGDDAFRFMLELFTIGYVLSTVSYFDIYSGVPFPFGDVFISRSLCWALVFPVSRIIGYGSLFNFIFIPSMLISCVISSILSAIFMRLFSYINLAIK